MNPPPPPDAPADAGSGAEPLRPGAVFAERYEVVRRLGAGGMGAVYLARHREMGRLCAIKILHPALSKDPEAHRRFAHEARHASRVTHPNVCAVYDFGRTAEGEVFLAMEYVEGRPLAAVLAEQGRLPLARAAALVREIAAGLDAAHAIQLVHRDLKPDNVIVTRTPGGESVKLVDFGIAKAAHSDLPGAETAAGVVVGTPDYMSPEQFAGDPVDHRSDLYSLGLVFYRAVTGTLPFRAATARESLARRLTERPAPLAEAAPGLRVPEALQAALDRVLARDPGQRFAHASEFARAVEAAERALPADPAADAPTVRLDAPTGALPGAPRRETRSLARRVSAGALALAIVAGAAWGVRDLLRRPDGGAGPTVLRPGPGAADTAGDSAPQGPTPPPASAGPPTRPAATETAGGRPQLLPLPALPTAEEIADPASRDAARARAEQIYRRPDAGTLVRAQAAFSAATAYNMDERYAAAVRWAEFALEMNARLPADPARDARHQGYESFLALVRLKLKEPTTP